MSFNQLHGVSVAGVAACVPENVVKNADYPLFTAEEYQKFLDGVGIAEKRVTEAGVCTSDLCFLAAERLLLDLGWNKEDVGVLIFVSHTADYKLPATSCILQERLGLPTSCMTLDISLGCSGYPHGLQVMGALLSSGSIKKGLLLVGNTQSHYASMEDKSVYPLFADAGTATAMEFREGAMPMFFEFGTDGSGFQSILLEDGGCRNPVTPASFDMQTHAPGIRRSRLHESMDGLEVYSFGVSRVPESVRSLCKEFEIHLERLDYYLFHQANKMMILKIAKKLGLDQEKVPLNLDRFGNSSCATLPLLMVTELAEALRNRPLRLLLSGFGVGLSWGSVVLGTEPMVVSELLEYPNRTVGGQ